MNLAINDIAPDFTLITEDGPWQLSSCKDKKMVVLFFYPKDDTLMCTREAKDFNCLKSVFDQLDTVVIGISRDDVNSHQRFRKAYDLQLSLASDTDSSVCTKYGVINNKSIFSKIFPMVSRTTFLIDKRGKIVRIWHKVSVSGHAEEVLQVVKSMQ